jgi:MFS family permease
MLFRFSLYGFLKNQQYFEPFLVLALLDKGLSFFQIGILVGIREAAVNLLEIPSGAVADHFGRRGAMILSFTGFVIGFVLLGAATTMPGLTAGMLLFSVGETFRTGTHKAMIFAWLKGQGRTAERTRFYGITRSWAKLGSALAALIGAAIVFFTRRFEVLFYASVIPYLLGIVNFLGYPAALDERSGAPRSMRGVARTVGRSLRLSFRREGLRRLMLETMGFDGTFHTVKDYVQPAIQMAAAALVGGWAIASGWTESQRTAALTAPVYVVLAVAASVASRRSHRVAARAGGEGRAAQWLWWGTAAVFAVIMVAAAGDAATLVVMGFVALHVLYNLWRPVMIGRFGAHVGGEGGATVLSVESQARRTTTMVAAPLLGLAVDRVKDVGGGGALWPVGALGLAVAIGFAMLPARREEAA